MTAAEAAQEEQAVEEREAVAVAEEEEEEEEDVVVEEAAVEVAVEEEDLKAMRACRASSFILLYLKYYHDLSLSCCYVTSKYANITFDS